MRLSHNEVKALRKGFEESALCPTHYEVFLFGSRADDSKKGGDIDLLLIVKDEVLVKVLKESQHHLLVAFKKYLEDQKLDLTIVSCEEFNKKRQQDAFLRLISKSMTPLFAR